MSNYIVFNTAGKPPEFFISYNGNERYFSCPDERSTSETMLQLLDENLTALNADLKTFDFFGCVTGPGSFTGIRIGINTARAFAHVYEKDIVAITYPELLKADAKNEKNRPIITVVYGWGTTCYITMFDADGTYLRETFAVSFDEALLIINTGDAEVITDTMSGEILKKGTVYSPEAAFKKIIEKKTKDGLFINYSALEPYYVLESQAERELKNKQ